MWKPLKTQLSRESRWSDFITFKMLVCFNLITLCFWKKLRLMNVRVHSRGCRVNWQLTRSVSHASDFGSLILEIEWIFRNDLWQWTINCHNNVKTIVIMIRTRGRRVLQRQSGKSVFWDDKGTLFSAKERKGSRIIRLLDLLVVKFRRNYIAITLKMVLRVYHLENNHVSTELVFSIIPSIILFSEFGTHWFSFLSKLWKILARKKIFMKKRKWLHFEKHCYKGCMISRYLSVRYT